MTDDTGYAGRSVLVSGASGILGSSLVARLVSDGASVVALIRDVDPESELFRSGVADRVTRVHGSLADLGLLERVIVQYDVEVVFHLGAQTQVRHAHRQPLETFESNVRGTYLLLEAIRRANGQVKATIVASSDKAYGESSDLPYRETHILAGRNVYDASKSITDLIASSYGASFGLPIAIVRCGNLYGAGDLNWDRIVPGTVRALIRGEQPVVRSDGTPRRDYLYVDDAVEGYLSLGRAVLAGREHGEAFNFGHGEPISVLEVIARIEDAVGRHDLPPIVLADATHEIDAQWLDWTKAATRLGWSPGVSFEDGLARTVAWYRTVLS